jgi:hypothetical protein
MLAARSSREFDTTATLRGRERLEEVGEAAHVREQHAGY